jgi:negative regulator of sigma E activity
MTRDELEFSISQYLDGTLAEAEEAALESRLASDADARALLGEYRRLDRTLKSAPLPAFDYGALSDRISAAVSREAEPAQSYRLHWVRTAAALAIAACVVIAVGVGIRRLGPAGQTDPRQQAVVPPTVPAPAIERKQIVVVDGGPRSQPSTAPVEILAVGPSPAAGDGPALARYQEDLISRPSQVIIARTGRGAEEGAILP